MYFVWRMNTDKRADHELVTDGYYEQELRYQEEIDALKATERDDHQLLISRPNSGGGLLVHFPEHLDHHKINGILSLYRPSDRQLDSDLELDLSNSSMLIPDSRLLDGRWDIKVKWEYQGTMYQYKETIYY